MKNTVYAVKVGEYWAKEIYDSIELHPIPFAFDSFKDAYSIAQKVGGELHTLKPEPMDGEAVQTALEGLCDE